MKRYEKMGIDPTTNEGIRQILRGYFNTTKSGDEYVEWLCEEVPTVMKRRIDAYPIEELSGMFIKHCKKSICETCRYHNGTCACILNFAAEEVEVEE